MFIPIILNGIYLTKHLNESKRLRNIPALAEHVSSTWKFIIFKYYLYTAEKEALKINIYIGTMSILHSQTTVV